MMENNKPTELVIPGSIIPSEAERAQMRVMNKPFLPSIKLIQGISAEVKEENIEAGHFLISNTHTNLKQDFTILVLGRRSHALLMINNKKSKESFNFDSPIFKEIMSTPSDRPNGINSFWGNDFLIYVPKVGEFVTFFCGKPSNREIGWSIVDHMIPFKDREKGKTDLPHTNCFQLDSIFETTKFGSDYRCHCPIITPLEPSKEFFPDQNSLESAAKIFHTPVQNEAKVEEADQEEPER